MRWLLYFLLPLSLFAQDKYWIEWDGELTTPDQRAFAIWAYQYGDSVARGETLFWITKSESSWNVQTDGDDGKSIGPFQIDSTTAIWISEKMGDPILPENIRWILENDFDRAAGMALWYFEYWYDKHLGWLGPGWRHKRYARVRAISAYRYGYEEENASEKYKAAANKWTSFAADSLSKYIK